MFNTNHSVTTLQATFGQAKSIIFEDYKFISRSLVFAFGREWLSLPEAGTVEYNNLLGAGVFSEGDQVIFGNVPHVCDVTSIRICRPKLAQRAYFNGHKKYHTVDFHCVHSGTGRVYSVVGPIPGAHNDVHSARQSLIYS